MNADSQSPRVVRAGDVMQSHVDIVDGLVTVSDVIVLLKRSESHAVIVDRRHEEDEFGIVVIADIAKHVLGRDRSPDRVNVYEIMAKPVVSVPPYMDIRYCVRLFQNFGLAVAPVMDGRDVVGLLRYEHMVIKGML